MASSSGLPENSGLKYNQLNCGTWNGRFLAALGWVDLLEGQVEGLVDLVEDLVE